MTSLYWDGLLDTIHDRGYFIGHMVSREVTYVVKLDVLFNSAPVTIPGYHVEWAPHCMQHELTDFTHDYVMILLCALHIASDHRKVWAYRGIQGLYSLRRRRLISIGIPIINLRRSSDRLRLIIGIPIPVRRRLLSESRPRIQTR